MKHAIAMFLVFSCALAICAGAWAQIQITTAIVGTVTDPSGAVVAAVSITVRNDDTGAVRETVTNNVGYYSVQALKPGKYSFYCPVPGHEAAGMKGTLIVK